MPGTPHKRLVVCCDGTELPEDVLAKVAELYADDFGLGDEAHPCDHKSSTAEGGAVRSQYVAPALA